MLIADIIPVYIIYIIYFNRQGGSNEFRGDQWSADIFFLGGGDHGVQDRDLMGFGWGGGLGDVQGVQGGIH